MRRAYDPGAGTISLLAKLFVIGAALAIVVGAGVAHVSGPAAGQSMLTIDADHALTTDAKQAAFEQTGVATASLNAPDLSITVAADHDGKGCGIKGWHSDLRNDYLCLQYNEEIDRQVRIFIPAEYWTPYLRTSVDEVGGGPAATFEPVENGQYTSVTVTLSGSGTYAYPVTKEASFFAGARDRTLGNLENITGVGYPERQAWQYIPAERLGGNQSAYVVRAPNGTENLLLEYETSDGGWSTVPDGAKSFAPVYFETKRGVEGRAYVFATTSDPPRVRYKTQAGGRDQLGAAFREIGQIPSRLEEILNINIPFFGG